MMEVSRNVKTKRLATLHVVEITVEGLTAQLRFQNGSFEKATLPGSTFFEREETLERWYALIDAVLAEIERNRAAGNEELSVKMAKEWDEHDRAE